MLAYLLIGALAVGAADSPKPTLLGLAQKTAVKGTDAALGKNAVLYLRLDGLNLKVASEVPPELTTDGFAHDFYACLQDGALVCVIFAAHKKEPPKVRATYFKADMTGRLDRVAALSGALDEDGQPVKGSGLMSQLDPEDPDTVKRFRHEVDFWLKGSYRKPAPPSAAPAISSTTQHRP